MEETEVRAAPPSPTSHDEDKTGAAAAAAAAVNQPKRPAWLTGSWLFGAILDLFYIFIY